eukprot:scaffold27452_cov78-Skeletonema_dohrnii-CCMP3373.AAC.2
MTTNVSAHEDNKNSSAVILAQTNPPDPEHTPNSKFFQARWGRMKEIMIRVASCRRLILYGHKLGFFWYRDEERRQERERREREKWSGGQGGNPSKWSFHSYLPHI